MADAIPIIDVWTQHISGTPPGANPEGRAIDGGRWEYEYLWARAATIYAGTSEVQRNVIAQRVLGLPRGT